MSAKTVQISIDVELLRRVDAQPEARERGRSAFVCLAIESYLRTKERRRVDEAIAAAYGADADAMLAEVEDVLASRLGPTSEPRQHLAARAAAARQATAGRDPGRP